MEKREGGERREMEGESGKKRKMWRGNEGGGGEERREGGKRRREEMKGGKEDERKGDRTESGSGTYRSNHTGSAHSEWMMPRFTPSKLILT